MWVLNLLVLAPDFRPNLGGVAEYMWGLTYHLHLQGHQVQVGTIERSQAAQFDTQQPIVIYRSRHRGIFLLFDFLRLLRRLSSSVDVIICESWNPAGIAAWLAHILFGSTYVVISHGSDVTSDVRRFLQVVKGPIQGGVFRGAAKIMANSSYTRDLLLAKGISPQQITVINPGVEVPAPVDPDEVRKMRATILKDTAQGSGAVMLLTVARLVPHKGHDVVLKALSQIADKIPEFRYVIVGTGSQSYRSELEALTDSLGLKDRVVFWGAASAVEIPLLYAACDLFVLVSRPQGRATEGFGMVFLEASSRGRPVLGGKTGGIVDAVQDGVTGLLVDPNDVAAVGAAIVEILSHPQTAKAMGERGLKHVLDDQITWEWVTKRFADELQRSLGKIDARSVS